MEQAESKAAELAELKRDIEQLRGGEKDRKLKEDGMIEMKRGGLKFERVRGETVGEGHAAVR